MPRYLVVANVTLGGDHLLELLRERIAAGGARLHVLVPAFPQQEGWGTHDEDADERIAKERLELALERFAALRPEAIGGEVGAPRPIDAIGDVVRREAADPFDEIVISTLPAGPSRWLRLDLPSRAERAFGIPVTHVVARDRG